MSFENLTPEQQEKARACKTVDELVSYAKSEGIELEENNLNDISAGGDSGYDPNIRCPKCGYVGDVTRNGDDCECQRCSYTWKRSWSGHDHWV